MRPAEFPLTALCFHYRKEAALTHRDVLGSLLACGIRRDKVGDILCGREETAGQAVVFVDAELSDFLADQVDRIGGEGVAAETTMPGRCRLTGNIGKLRTRFLLPVWMPLSV